MRRFFSPLGRTLAAAAVTALLGGALCVTPAHAAELPDITYDGAVNELTVNSADGSGYTSDLFTTFKNVVPGDKLTQEVTIDLRNISATTNLYIQAADNQLTEDQLETLEKMTLTVSVEGGGVEPQIAPDAPQDVFDEDDPVLVATASSPTTATMTITLEVPVELGNEDFDKLRSSVSDQVVIPWIITVEEYEGSGGGIGGDEPGGDSSAVELHVADLTAYEGGLGSSSTSGRTDNLPEPEWGIEWQDARVTVDNEAWDVETQGLPFDWCYVTATGEPVPETGALAGLYRLMIEPLEGNPVVTVNGKLLELPADGVATLPDGSDVITEVRDVTDDAAADALAPTHFKDVFGGETRTLSNLFGLLGSSAVDGDFTASGTHTGSCDNTVAHAHVGAGTTFVKNGDADKPVNDGARVGLLWDDLISNVLGQTEHMETLDAKARAVIGWTDEEGVQTRFRYLDLVDMNDGNVWVATADGSDTTIFVPYPEGVSPEDDVAIVRFDGLTRDYTVGLPGSSLDEAVAASAAHAVAVTKTADGLLFGVPCAEFGPFELLWKPAAGEEPAPGPGGDEPDGPDEPGGTDEPGGPGGTDEPGTPGGEDQTDRPHDEVIAETGDPLPTFMPLLVVAGVALIVLAVLLARRRRKQ